MAPRKWAVVLSLLVLFCPTGPAQSRHAVATAQSECLNKLVVAATERTHHSVRYDPAYVRIPYPDGDVPAETGVCTDEIIRAYRAVGVDLQKLVHEDMLRGISAYPHKGQQRLVLDTSIDHRRVPNLMVFFSRNGETLPASLLLQDYS